jgi:hypothetical protein
VPRGQLIEAFVSPNPRYLRQGGLSLVRLPWAHAFGDCAAVRQARASARKLAAAPRRGRNGSLHEVGEAIRRHEYVECRCGGAAG